MIKKGESEGGEGGNELTPLMEEFEEETGKNAKWGGEVTKQFKEWREERGESESESDEESGGNLTPLMKKYKEQTGESPRKLVKELSDDYKKWRRKRRREKKNQDGDEEGKSEEDEASLIEQYKEETGKGAWDSGEGDSSTGEESGQEGGSEDKVTETESVSKSSEDGESGSTSGGSDEGGPGDSGRSKSVEEGSSRSGKGDELIPLMEEFEEETGKNAKWGGKITEQYREWKKRKTGEDNGVDGAKDKEARGKAPEETGPEKTETKPSGEGVSDETSETEEKESSRSRNGVQMGGGLTDIQVNDNEFGITESSLESLGTDEKLAELGEEIGSVAQARSEADFDKYSSFEIPRGSEEIERYWVKRPYVYVSILHDEQENEDIYHLVEPTLTPKEKSALEMLNENIVGELGYADSAQEKNRMLRDNTKEFLDNYGMDLDEDSVDKVIYYLRRNYLGYRKMDGLLRDPKVEDLSCDGANVPIFVYHRDYQSLRTNVLFKSSDLLNDFVTKVAEKTGKQITAADPTVHGTLPEGYRVQASLGSQVTTRGSSLSIRKYAEEPFTPVTLLEYNSFSPEMLAYLWLVTENQKNIMVAGGTASGKTSTLNSLSTFIWPNAKVVSIEDTRELVMYQDNWIPSVTRETSSKGGENIGMYELLRQALRQRPEVIIVGEVRGEEALTLFQSMVTGHTVYSTLHAGSIREVFHRLEGEPINVPHNMISALDVVCLQLLTNYKDERVRRNQVIAEVGDIGSLEGDSGGDELEDSSYQITESLEESSYLPFKYIFQRNSATDEFRKVGDSDILQEIANDRGWDDSRIEAELQNRERILRYMEKEGISSIDEVGSMVREYYFDPDEVLDRVSGV